MSVSLGSAHVFARAAFAHGVNVLTAATLRSACAALLLLALLLLKRTPPLPLPRQFRPTLILGLLLCAQTAMLQTAVWFLPAALAILVFYTFPFFTGLASILIGQGRFNWRLVGALAAAFAGLVLVVGVGDAPVSVAGIAAALGSSVLFTAVLLLTPKLASDLGAPLRTFYMLATAAAVFVAVSAVSGEFRLPEDPAGWIGLSGLAMLYAVGIVGLFLLLPRLGPVRTAVVLNLEPVAVALVAWLALDEALAPTQFAGGAVVVAAVIFYQATGRRP